MKKKCNPKTLPSRNMVSVQNPMGRTRFPEDIEYLIVGDNYHGLDVTEK